MALLIVKDFVLLIAIPDSIRCHFFTVQQICSKDPIIHYYLFKTKKKKKKKVVNGNNMGGLIEKRRFAMKEIFIFFFQGMRILSRTKIL